MGASSGGSSRAGGRAGGRRARTTFGQMRRIVRAGRTAGVTTSQARRQMNIITRGR